jgi:hypothetical protein
VKLKFSARNLGRPRIVIIPDLYLWGPSFKSWPEINCTDSGYSWFPSVPTI